MGQRPIFLPLGTIACLLWFLQCYTSVTSQNIKPLPQIKIIYRDNTNVVQVAEDAPLGFVLFQLEVTVGSNLRIESTLPYVNVTAVSNVNNRLLANATLAQKLDYDGEFKRAKLIFHFGNGDYQGLIYSVDLYVTNVNDEVPVFQNQPYLITVPENTPNGTTIGTNIKAKDRDENDYLYYYLQAKGSDVAEDYKTKFIISQDNANISLNGSLDFESNRFYQYTVTVSDTVHNTSTDVFITVSDIQDTPPEFIGAPFHATVEENSNQNIPLLTVKAEDGDRGAPNSITFRIFTGSETCPGSFKIDANSGDITSMSPLDRDAGDVLNNSGICSLIVEAVEGSEHLQGSSTSKSTAQTNVTFTITDVDDNTPQFSASNFSATLDENTQQGVPITTTTPIIVNDKDQGTNAKFEVKVINLPTVFEASPSIVQTTSEILIRVKDSSYLDYELRQSISIELEAKPVNAAPNTKGSTALIDLKLKNINDNSPNFTKLSISGSVEEGKQNFQIMTIKATDADLNFDGQNFGTVTYSLDGLDPNFELNKVTGDLRVKANASLDRETKDLYYLTVIAEDGGHNKVTTQINIKITDMNDCSPSFVTDDYQTSLQENSTSFSRVLKVHATDNDEQGKPNSEIVYIISSSKPLGLQSSFSVNQTSGVLSVVRALDYENISFPKGQEGKIVLTLMAKDKGSLPLNSTVDAIIMLQDVNDNHPSCKNILDSKVSENETKSSVLVTVAANDNDGTAPNNLIIYSIDQQNAEKFIMDSNSGKISLRSALDRETKNYYDIIVTVNDLGLPSLNGSCHVTINVTDINDTPPSFDMSTKSVTIKENGPIKILNVTAKDVDSHPKLKFGIDWSKSTATDLTGLQTAKFNTSWITINSVTGNIEVRSLDREAVTSFTLALTVEDENSQTGLQQDITSLTVHVMDENDNAPTFSKSSYQAAIQENMPKGSEIHTNYALTVQDLDEGDNSEFSVSLISYKESFTVDPLNGKGSENFIISVLNSSILDFETVEVLELKLLTVETKTNVKYSGTTTVTLSLINKNDNMPYFIGAPFTANIFENMHAGTTVISVNASDADKGEYGVLNYFFHSESPQFLINSTTGVVTTKLPLDREIQSSYTLTVHVEDVDHFDTMTQLTITVKDENDKPPIFTQPLYNTNIPEKQLNFIPPFIVQAFDKDEAGTKNSEISYSINSTTPSLPSKFNISTVSGEITLTSALDFEALDQKLQGRILVVVVAKDKSSPFHSTTVTATINVMDVNDEVPMFGSSEYTLHKPENIKAGTPIFNQSAHDNDTSSDNSRISYSIDTLSASIFSCDENTGVITLKTALDYEMTEHYDIIVTVRDHGSPVLTSTIVVHLNVTDINDVRPQFLEKQMSTTIGENTPFSFNCSARDSDKDADLYYSIDWLKSSGQTSDGKTVDNNELQKWMKMRDARYCQLISVKDFDRETVAKFTIQLKVEDKKGIMNVPQFDTASLVIDVLDENDFCPTFNMNGYKAEIRENMPQGSDIRFISPAIFEVFDLDSVGINSQFKLVLLDHDKTFKIEPDEGTSQQVFTLSVLDSTDLDYENTQNITLKVMAVEINTKQKFNTTATITVDIINVNDNIPEFEQGPYNGHVSELSPSHTTFVTLYAEDHDKGFYGTLTYSLKDDAKKFGINETSGEVYTLTNDLDREATASYTVTAIAKDGGNFTANTQLTITIDDVNDNYPVFSSTSYRVEIEERKNKFEPGFFVHATDNDETNNANSRIKYKLLNATGPAKSNFTINETTGELYLKSAIDFEALGNGGIIILSVQAQDLGVTELSSTAEISVVVLDANDEIPIFSKSSYSKSVKENAALGSSVIQVQAIDSDKSTSNNQVSYMIDVLSANTFSINNTGIITIKNKLDREQIEHYNITVTALDNGQPTQTSTVTVSISVLDVNDSPPQFSRESASTEVTENSNKDIYTLDAVDHDANHNLRYSILWSASSGVNGAGQFVDGSYLQKYVDINNSTGTVYPKQNLDREAVQRLQLTLLVEDLNGLPDTQQNDTAMLTVVVKDVNDNPPKFVGASKFVATIQENMPNGSELKFVNISALTIDDPDGEGNNNYTVALTGSPAFLISPTRGAGKVSCVVTVADSRVLDYEMQQNFTLTVTATDMHDVSMNSTITIIVELINENDNIPQFVGAPYIGNITEGSKEHTTVTIIHANDSDLGDFGKVKYSLKDDNKRFAINETSGLVYSLVSDLDRETSPSYTVTVTATDQGNFTAMSQLTVYLLDVDDEPPVFTQSEYNMEISEGSSHFTSGFIVHAMDGDEPSTPNSNVRYSLLNEGQRFYSNLKINETSGEVGIKTPLDFEDIPGGVIYLTVQAQDQGIHHLNTTSKITLKVKDINDNSPMFNQTHYKYNISENASVGDFVGPVSSSDADLSHENNQVSYVIDVLSANKFEIDTKGIISVKEKLDREQTEYYNITVTALDNGHPTLTSTVTVTVSLLDVNDSPPQFTRHSVTKSVKENSRVLLASNKASDLDENPALVYSILWDESSGVDGDGQYLDGNVLKNHINIDRATGDVYPNQTLDREATQRFQLMLLVTDSNAVGSPQNDTAMLTVIVEDEDDNSPHFVGGNSFQASIQENMPAGSEVKLANISSLTIDDPDAFGNNRYNITLEGSPAFTITPSYGEGKTVCIISVADAGLLDYEKNSSFQLKVTATDYSLNKLQSNSANIVVQVLNENDNIPEFLGSPPFHASISEDSANHTSIITINATDHDFGHFGELSFFIKDDSNNFGINSSTGDVYSITSGFDREVTPSYIVTITVRDGGNFIATTQLTINVADVNDETPSFTQANYKVTIDENKNEFLPAFFVQARDKDEPNTLNSNITYSMLNAGKNPETNFRINDITGQLYLKESLDYEKLNQTHRGGIALIVEAKDQGVPPKSGTAIITVTVVDLNDNSPQFISSNGPFRILENVTFGHNVAQTQARDNDTSPSNNQITYMIDILSANTFNIDNTTGCITVKGQLDREQIDHYDIIVTALDNGNPPLTSTVTVTVNLQDVNDSPPQFTWDTRTVNSIENVKAMIAVDKATDHDLDKDLFYSIVWSESSGIDGVGRYANGSKLQKYIGINATTGEIFATEDLDREAIQRFQLALMVEDRAAVGQQQNDTAILTVIIEDSNDNSPVFLDGNYFTARIRENMPIGSDVKFQNVTALVVNDADEGINSAYSIYLVDNSVFTISPSQGEEQTPCVISVANSSLLDFEKNESFTIEVVVTERLTPELHTNTATITIFLDNENDNFPRFEAPALEISVPENSKLGHLVTRVEAKDADTGNFGIVHYSIDGDQTRFIINSSTGEITLNSTDLDWETRNTYSLTVRATDSGHFDTSMQLNIKVTDINDQPPIFKTEFIAEADENSLSFHSPLFVKASDADEPGTNNSQIVYSITQTPSQLGNRSLFYIDNTSGEVTLLESFDFEELLSKGVYNRLLQLEVTAKDLGSPQLNGSTIVKVVVNDINDFAPNFTSASYKFTVKENSPPDVSVGTIHATDKDGTSPNNELYYVIQSGGQDKFQMNSSTGEISVGVGAILDREDKVTYNLIVLAIDRGSPAESSSATVLVTVSDVNDSPPVFNSSQIEQQYSTYENAAKGTGILTVVATDPDSNFDLKYSLQWDSSRAFDEKDRDVNISIVQEWLVVDKKTGAISVNSQLDRETAEQIILRITVEDVIAEMPKPQISTATVTIIILDVNDEAPEILYIGSQQSMRVSEGTKLDTEVTTLTATDKDKDQTVTFSLINSVYFNITQSGKLTVSKQLDREVVDKLNFTVVATDNGRPPLSSSITIGVQVLDINDNDPEFSSNQTSFTVEENSANTTFIAKINATDRDEGPNANITFEFKDISPYRIDPITGDIYVSEPLDREIKSSYTLTVFATDNPLLEQRRRSSIVIQIEVTDMNDNAPVFGITIPSYTAKISEISKQNDLVLISPEMISAKDQDVGQNANITFSLKSVNASSEDFFKIDPRTGQVSVNRTDLRDMPGEYSYVVTATDQGIPSKSANASLTVTILDENINSPVFVSKGPLPAIPECARVGFSVYQFNAIDADKEKSTNGLVHYYLINGTEAPGWELFNLNAQTGWLTVAAKLDADGDGLLKIKVKAVDFGIPQNTKETEVLDILVTDINDNPPEFIQEQTKVFSVREESDKIEIGQVRATDKDRGSIITYVIDDPDNAWKNYFLITTDTNSKEGVIQVVKSFDRETISSVQLTLRAVDNSSISKLDACDNVSPVDNRQSSPLKITVNIQDIDDNPPVFKERSLSKGFLSKTAPNNIILNLKDYVTDNDTEVNSVHRFYQLGDLQADEQLSKGWSPQVKADPILVGINGTITTNFKFPEDQFGVLTLRVLANDSGGNDTLNLKIYVVGDTQVVHMSFFNTEDELRHFQLQVTEQLSEQGYRFVPDDIMPFYDEKGTVDGTKSVLVVHAVEESTGKIIDGATLLSKLDSKDKVNILNQYKIIKSETGDKASSKSVNSPDSRTQYILIGVIIVIAITFVITLYMLIHNIQRFKRKLKAATIDVHGMDPIKFPGLDNDRIKDQNPIFMRDDLVIDESGSDGYSDSYSQTSENSIDKNAMNEEHHGIDEQEVTLNLYGADGQYFNDASDVPNPMRYLHNVIEGGPEGDNFEDLVGTRRVAREFPPEYDSDEDNVFSFSTSNFESTEI